MNNNLIFYCSCQIIRSLFRVLGIYTVVQLTWHKGRNRPEWWCCHGPKTLHLLFPQEGCQWPLVLTWHQSTSYQSHEREQKEKKVRHYDCKVAWPQFWSTVLHSQQNTNFCWKCIDAVKNRFLDGVDKNKY